MQDELKVGDIIIVDSFGSQGVSVGRHSFVVIDDTNNEVCGLDYDFIESMPEKGIKIQRIIDNL